MGLDAVEFILAVEDAFGISIPDRDAERLVTPGQLVDYLVAHVPSGFSPPACFEQRAFYRLRQVGTSVLGAPRSAVAPGTPWSSLLTEGQMRQEWELLGQTLRIERWPRLKPLLRFGPPTASVGDTARRLAITSPAALLDSGEGWNRDAIESAVRALIADELGITAFQWTDRFVQDLGID